MELTISDIEKFKKLYREKFDIDLNDQEARQQLSLLVRQMELVYQPITKQQLEEFEAERERDALALAELIYDIYQDKKTQEKDKD